MSDGPNNQQNTRTNRNNNEAGDEELTEEQRLLQRFPVVPTIHHDVPPPPKIVVDLPPHPDAPKPGRPEPGSFRNTALASQAASSFFMPVLVLMLAGLVVDKQFHTGGIAIVIGCILGLVVGVTNLLRVSSKMDDTPRKKP